eukprot:Gb_24318 [translate_table: standard]
MSDHEDTIKPNYKIFIGVGKPLLPLENIYSEIARDSCASERLSHPTCLVCSVVLEYLIIQRKVTIPMLLCMTGEDMQTCLRKAMDGLLIDWEKKLGEVNLVQEGSKCNETHGGIKAKGTCANTGRDLVSWQDKSSLEALRKRTRNEVGTRYEFPEHFSITVSKAPRQRKDHQRRTVSWELFLLGIVRDPFTPQDTLISQGTPNAFLVGVLPTWLTKEMSKAQGSYELPDEAPRLNAYSQLHRKKGVKKDKRVDSYWGKFYLTLRQLNDGIEASKQLLEYIKKQWREALQAEDDRTMNILQGIMTYSPGSQVRPKRQLIIDHPFFSLRAQHYYWTINKEHFSKEPFSMAWSLPDLPTISLLEVQRKGDTTEKEKKKKSAPKGNLVSGTAQELAMRVEELELENRLIGSFTPGRACYLGHKDPPQHSPLESKIVNLQEQVDDLQTEVEKKEQELVEHVAKIQQLKATPAQLIANVQKWLTSAREEVGYFKRYLNMRLDIVAKGKETHLVWLSQLVKMSDQLALKRASLENEYYELLGVKDQEQRIRKEATTLWIREELDPMRSKFL